MPSLIKQPDGSVLWDYDLPKQETEKPAKKSAPKKAAAEKETGE